MQTNTVIHLHILSYNDAFTVIGQCWPTQYEGGLSKHQCGLEAPRVSELFPVTAHARLSPQAPLKA